MIEYSPKNLASEEKATPPQLFKMHFERLFVKVGCFFQATVTQCGLSCLFLLLLLSCCCFGRCFCGRPLDRRVRAIPLRKNKDYQWKDESAPLVAL